MLSRIFGRKPPAPTQLTRVASQPPPIIDVTDATFGEIVEASELLVVVDVWAEWCQPCQTMSAFVGFLAKEYAGRLLVTALDADENPEVTQRFNIMGLPTLLFIKNGREVDRIVGLVDYTEIKRVMETIMV